MLLAKLTFWAGVVLLCVVIIFEIIMITGCCGAPSNKGSRITLGISAGMFGLFTSVALILMGIQHWNLDR